MTITRTKFCADTCALLRDLVRGFTQDHDALAIEGGEMSNVVAIGIKSSARDYPRIVGSQGKHIWALQTIAIAAGRKAGKTVRVTLPPMAKAAVPPREFEPNAAWNNKPLTKLLKRVAAATLPVSAVIEAGDLSDSTTFVITSEMCDVIARGDLTQAVHSIFHAIGKNHGRIVMVEFAARESATV